MAGQSRSVVSNQLAISQSEAALLLEFADNGTLEIALKDGSVVIDGDDRGSFVRGDALDIAWRSLLGEIVSLSDTTKHAIRDSREKIENLLYELNDNELRLALIAEVAHQFLVSYRESQLSTANDQEIKSAQGDVIDAG